MLTSYGPTATRTVSGLQACTRCVEAAGTARDGRHAMVGGRWCRAIWSVNAVRAMSGCRAHTRSIEAALRNLIAQGSCCIAQPHGQRRTAVTAKRMTSPYGVMVCPEC